MRFHTMTWKEIAAVDRKQCIVLIPVGATEQHGPHLPVNTDYLIADSLGKSLESAFPDRLLLAPTSWLGHSPHHLSFGGTISANDRVYVDMIVEICRSFAGMGFHKLLLVNGHGGNRVPLSVVLQHMKEISPETQVFSCEFWNVAKQEILSIRESDEGGMGHACELETSLYLYLDEDAVRGELIADDGVMSKSGYFQGEMFKAGPVSYLANFEEFTSSGVFGRPSLASREKGEQFYKCIVAALSQLIEELLTLGQIYEK